MTSLKKLLCTAVHVTYLLKTVVKYRSDTSNTQRKQVFLAAYNLISFPYKLIRYTALQWHIAAIKKKLIWVGHVGNQYESNHEAYPGHLNHETRDKWAETLQIQHIRPCQDIIHQCHVTENTLFTISKLRVQETHKMTNFRPRGIRNAAISVSKS